MHRCLRNPHNYIRCREIEFKKTWTIINSIPKISSTKLNHDSLKFPFKIRCPWHRLRKLGTDRNITRHLTPNNILNPLNKNTGFPIFSKSVNKTLLTLCTLCITSSGRKKPTTTYRKELFAVIYSDNMVNKRINVKVPWFEVILNPNQLRSLKLPCQHAIASLGRGISTVSKHVESLHTSFLLALRPFY